MDGGVIGGAFSFSNRRVSHHVMEILDLEPGEQHRVIAVRNNVANMNVYDDVMLAARAWKEIRSPFYVKNMKFCFDEEDETVYCLAFEDLQASYFRGYQVSIGTGVFAMCQVKSIVEKKKSFREFIDIPIGDKVCV